MGRVKSRHVQRWRMTDACAGLEAEGKRCEVAEWMKVITDRVGIADGVMPYMERLRDKYQSYLAMASSGSNKVPEYRP